MKVTALARVKASLGFRDSRKTPNLRSKLQAKHEYKKETDEHEIFDAA
jgi:hypothetical protein